MASYREYQENVNPLQDIRNRPYPYLVKSGPPRTTLPTSKPSGMPSKLQIKNIQNVHTLTSASSELKFFQRPHASSSNKFAKRPITAGMPLNVEHIIQPHPNSKTAGVAIQRQAVYKNASSPKRQRLEKVEDANDVYRIKGIIKKPSESTVAQSHNKQAISPAINKVIPTNSTVRTAPEVPPKVANTPHGLEREQHNNGTHTFARNRTQNDDEEFFKSLTLDNIKLRKKELTRLQSYYRNNVDGITLSEEMQELEKKINILEQGIERSKKIRSDIAKTKSIKIFGKYTCKKCKKGYEKQGNIFNHVLVSHPETFEEYKPARRNEAARTRTHNRDDTYSLTSHSRSINSQLTLMDSNVSPQRVPSHDFNIQNDNSNQVRNETDPVGKHTPISSGRKVIENARTEHIPVKTTDSRIRLQTAVEIRQDNPLWKKIYINFVPRKSVDFLGHKSFELFEKYERKIRNMMKKNRSSSLATSANKTKNSASQQMPKRNNSTFHDGSAQLKKYYLDLTYTKAELDQINHCYMNKNTDFLCEVCVYNLAGFQAKQYAVCKAAYDEHEKITKDRSLSNQKKKRKLKELVTKDEYRLIRDRLKDVNAKRGSFNLIPMVVKYNRNYFLLLQKALNDMKIREFVDLDRSNLTTYKFGVYCSKLMDDIVNEFLVQVTVTCMNFAYQQRNVTLTKELLSQHQAFFKMTNKDATYLEPCSPDMGDFFKTNYLSSLPKTHDLEVLIIDCLLRHCFSDENTMHENLDDLIFEHLKSPQPIFKFLMYMKFTKPYLEMIRCLLLKFLFQLSVEVLKLKKETESNDLVTFEELIEACEIVGVFGSSYIHYLRKSYTHYFEAFLLT